MVYLPLVAVGSSAYGPRSGGPIPANTGVTLLNVVGASKAHLERHFIRVRHALLHRDAALQLLATAFSAPRHPRHKKQFGMISNSP